MAGKTGVIFPRRELSLQKWRTVGLCVVFEAGMKQAGRKVEGDGKESFQFGA